MGNTEYSNDRESQQSAVQSQMSERKRGGNPNPQNTFPKRNNAAEKHGIYIAFIPRCKAFSLVTRMVTLLMKPCTLSET